MSFSYTSGRYELTRASAAGDGIVCFTGENLDKKN